MSMPRALTWSLVGQAVTFGAALGSSVVLARLIVPAEMGLFVLANALVGSLTATVSIALGSHVVRSPGTDQVALDTAFTLNAVVGVCLSALFFGFAGVIGAGLGHPSITPVLRVLAAGPILASCEFRPAVLLQRGMAFRPLAILNAVKVVTSALVAVALAAVGHGAASLAWGYLAGGAVGAIAANFLGRDQARYRLSVAGLGSVALFGLRALTSAGAAPLTARLAEIVLGSLVGLNALGLYSRAAGIVSLVADNLYAAVSRVVFVQLADELTTTGQLRDRGLRSLATITALFWPALVGLAVLSRPAVLLVYGEEWVGAAVPLALLMLALTIGLATALNWELTVLRDETGRQAWLETARAVLGLALFSVGCLGGLAGAAATRIVDAFLAVLVYRRPYARMLAAEPADLHRIYRQGALLTLAAIAPSLTLMTWTDGSAFTPRAAIFAAVMLGVVLWLVLLSRLDHPLRAALRSTLARVWSATV